MPRVITWDDNDVEVDQDERTIKLATPITQEERVTLKGLRSELEALNDIIEDARGRKTEIQAKILEVKTALGLIGKVS